MAAKALAKSVVDDILLEWRLGQLSQQKIAQMKDVSKGVVNKICKGVAQDLASNVTAGVQYQQALSQHDDRIVNAVSKTVDEISKRLNFFRGANMLVARTVVSKVQTDGTNASYQDLNAAATALGRAQESVVGKLQKNFDTNTVQGEQRHLPVCSPEQLRAINSMLESQC